MHRLASRLDIAERTATPEAPTEIVVVFVNDGDPEPATTEPPTAADALRPVRFIDLRKPLPSTNA